MTWGTGLFGCIGRGFGGGMLINGGVGVNTTFGGRGGCGPGVCGGWVGYIGAGVGE